MRWISPLISRSLPIWILLIVSLMSGCRLTPAQSTAQISTLTPVQSQPLPQSITPTSEILDQTTATRSSVATETSIALPTDTPEPGGSFGFPPTRIHLSVQYDHTSYTLEATEQIEYNNHSTVNLSDLVLLVEANRYPGVFHLSNLTWQDGEAVEGYE